MRHLHLGDSQVHWQEWQSVVSAVTAAVRVSHVIYRERCVLPATMEEKASLSHSSFD